MTYPYNAYTPCLCRHTMVLHEWRGCLACGCRTFQPREPKYAERTR